MIMSLSTPFWEFPDSEKYCYKCKRKIEIFLLPFGSFFSLGGNLKQKWFKLDFLLPFGSFVGSTAYQNIETNLPTLSTPLLGVSHGRKVYKLCSE